MRAQFISIKEAFCWLLVIAFLTEQTSLCFAANSEMFPNSEELQQIADEAAKKAALAREDEQDLLLHRKDAAQIIDRILADLRVLPKERINEKLTDYGAPFPSGKAKLCLRYLGRKMAQAMVGRDISAPTDAESNSAQNPKVVPAEQALPSGQTPFRLAALVTPPTSAPTRPTPEDLIYQVLATANYLTVKYTESNINDAETAARIQKSPNYKAWQQRRISERFWVKEGLIFLTSLLAIIAKMGNDYTNLFDAIQRHDAMRFIEKFYSTALFIWGRFDGSQGLEKVIEVFKRDHLISQSVYFAAIFGALSILNLASSTHMKSKFEGDRAYLWDNSAENAIPFYLWSEFARGFQEKATNLGLKSDAIQSLLSALTNQKLKEVNALACQLALTNVTAANAEPGSSSTRVRAEVAPVSSGSGHSSDESETERRERPLVGEPDRGTH